jgi:ankyrin repeat protein
VSILQYIHIAIERNLETHAILSILQSLMAQVPPQEFLDKALKMRGYSTERYNTINSGYSNMPTQLQLVSYDAHILKMIIRDKDEHKIREMLTCGISPNACNKYGETLLHKVCKSGQDKLLQVFLDCGADVQISDGAGRTPMHDACWGSPPSLNTFELLMQQDPYLIHMMDGSGALPLSLVRKENYGAWNAFLVSILDIYWSPRDASTGNQGPPPLALEKANSRPAADPDQALSIELASLVSSGKMKPEDAMEAQSVTDFDDDTSTWFEDDDEEEEDSISFDDAELTELQNFNKFMVTAAY